MLQIDIKVCVMTQPDRHFGQFLSWILLTKIHTFVKVNEDLYPPETNVLWEQSRHCGLWRTLPMDVGELCQIRTMFPEGGTREVHHPPPM